MKSQEWGELLEEAYKVKHSLVASINQRYCCKSFEINQKKEKKESKWFDFMTYIPDFRENDYIVYDTKTDGVDVYFNPSATKGEISKINIGQRVRFGLGFSYDGPRAYNSSIKLLGKDEFVEVKREIESGIAVKCEVTKNVTHYVQVRIIGFSEIGSIYVNELVEPYSANNRPDIGTILDGKILMKKFDNAKHCNVWQITMNMNDIKEESKEETAMAQAIRLSGIKVR